MEASTSTAHQGCAAAISAVHPDILLNHILTRLDGPSLASTAVASSQLHLLTTEEKLWNDISLATWPSIKDPLLRHLISTFPNGHRSFFSDSFPLLDSRSPLITSRSFDPTTSGLISAVDLHYRDSLVFSKVQDTGMIKTDWFLCSPFRIDLLDPKESVSTPIRYGNEDPLKHLNENLKLSWVVIDPTKKRSANISSRSPVLVQRHWLTGDVQIRYTTIMAGDGRIGSSEEVVECTVVVTCVEKEGGEVHVREVSMHVEDMEGRHLNGRDSLGILGEGVGKGKRRKDRGGEGKESFEEYLEMRKERKERNQMKEKALDLFCVATGVSLFVAFWSFVLFR